MSGQYHFDPATYAELIAAEVPGYDRLQAQITQAAAERVATRILDLGIGTGETARRVLGTHPSAGLVGIDESAAMLDAARQSLPEADLRVSRLQDPLPDGGFDLIVSALAVHHLDGAEKAALFERVAAALRPGGRFVLGDVVVPDDPNDVVTPIDSEFDRPSRVDEQLAWLTSAGLRAELRWIEHDLAVFVAC